MSHYFENPQLNKVPMAIETFVKEGYLTNDSTVDSVIIFLSFIFRANPDQVSLWLKSLENLSEPVITEIGKALWFSDTAEAQQSLDTIIAEGSPAIKESLEFLLQESPPNIEDLPIASPDVLDMLWAAFAATGEEKYVTRLISALAYVNQDAEPHLSSIGNAARWSLQSNVDKYESVKSICTNQLNQQPQEISLILKELLADVNQNL
ncbi:hypothetical protein [Acaryochloris sp. IP29b_bin.137]|uniref:hypothetical protein n=1 Tax=Acaryochloris sp. IP29b_bin.137 TaxID=2969217 RepID=UPI00261C9A19|nr:hypothetical protein [Acaryochloris sp. IP29b_bin.137]